MFQINFWLRNWFDFSSYPRSTTYFHLFSRSEIHNTLRSQHGGHEQNSSPNTTNHELSLNDSCSGNGTFSNGTLRRHGATSGSNSQTHTLTKTNPYRHKVLTNGSFLNLNLNLNQQDVVGPLHSSGSDDVSNSSRPTTSTEDTNSDSGNETHGIKHSSNSNSNSNHHIQNHQQNLRRSKSSNNNHHKRFAYQNPPDLLPPPDGFDNSIIQQQQQHLQQQLQQQEAAPYTIDTGTAKAIIDTYSGHLFSRSTNYHSFRGTNKGNSTQQSNSSSQIGDNRDVRSKTRFPSSAVETLFTRDPTNFEQDSLDNSANNYYADQRNMTVVVPPNSSNVNKPNNTNTAPRVKTRTESVVWRSACSVLIIMKNHIIWAGTLE